MSSDPSTELVPIPPPNLLGRELAASVSRSSLYETVLSGRNARTVDAYRRDYSDFARFVNAAGPGEALDALLSLSPGTANAVVISYKTHLIDRGLATATIARRLSALKSAVKLAKMLGRVDWTLEVESPRVESYRDTQGPGDSGWRAMLATTKAAAVETAKGLRDLAILRLLHDLALRRAEAINLDLDDVDLEGGTVAIVGKGRTQASKLTLPDPVKKALGDWLVARGGRPGPVFIRLDPGASPDDPQRLTGRSVHRLVGSAGRKAGLTRDQRPHGLRHAGITKALDVLSGDIRKAMKFSRHRRPETLMIYDDSRLDVAGEVARRVSED